MLNNTAPLPAILDDIGPPSWCYETRFNGWNAAPDVYIPDYWKQFRAPAPYLHYMLGILYICLMSVAVLGNSIVMYIFCVFNGWNAAPDVYIPDYWKQFRAPAPYLHYMLGILYICLMSVAVLGNSIVMYIFCVFNGWNAAPDVYIPDYWKQFRAPAPYLHYMLGILYICLMSVAVLGNSIVMYIFCVFNGWNAAPDVYIPDYWKQFRAPAPYLHYMLGILYICLMSVAVLGNSIVMYIFCVFNGWNAAPDVYIPDYWKQFRAPAPYLHYMLGILYICLMSVAVLGNSIVMYIFCVFNGWNAAPDVYIPDYWKQFRAPAPYLHYMLGILYICLMSVAVLGNSIVMYIFCVSKSLRTPTNMFVIGLALADLLMMSKTPVFIYNCFHLGPVFGQIGCDIYAVVGTYSGIGSAFCNAVIAYDRYRVICHPFSKSGMTMTKAIAILVIVYLYITPFAILPALKIWSRFVPEGFLTSCAADFFMQDFNGRSYIVGTWFFGWFIPVMAIIFFYAQIFLAVKDHENKIKEQTWNTPTFGIPVLLLYNSLLEKPEGKHV